MLARDGQRLTSQPKNSSATKIELLSQASVAWLLARSGLSICNAQMLRDQFGDIFETNQSQWACGLSNH